MVSCLVFDLFLIFPSSKQIPAPKKGGMQNHIDFVEGEPVLDQALVTGKEGATEIGVKSPTCDGCANHRTPD